MVFVFSNVFFYISTIIASKPSSGNDHNQNRNRSAYAYAGIEFRPLHVTDEGAVSTAILEPSRRGVEELSYEHIDITTDNHEQKSSSSLIQTSDQASSGNKTVPKKPPPKPKPYSKSKDSDEIDAGKRRAPPPIPKPYCASQKNEKEETSPLPQQPQGI